MKQGICHYDYYLRPTAPVEHTRLHRTDIGRTAGGLLGIFSSWRQRARTRRDLSKLTAAQLDDVGLTYNEAQREINKPFWVE